MARSLRPLNDTALRELALSYAARYATTRRKLGDYLRRKVRERGWEQDNPPDFETIVSRLADLRYVDDEVYGRAKAGALKRRGMGEMRVRQALLVAGLDRETTDQLSSSTDEEAFASALIFARRRKIGPYCAGEADAKLRSKWIAAMLRAGHQMDIVKSIMAMPSGVNGAD